MIFKHYKHFRINKKQKIIFIIKIFNKILQILQTYKHQ